MALREVTRDSVAPVTRSSFLGHFLDNGLPVDEREFAFLSHLKACSSAAYSVFLLLSPLGNQGAVQPMMLIFCLYLTPVLEETFLP